MSWIKAARIWSLALIIALLALTMAFADLRKIANAFSGVKWEWAVLVPILNLANTYIEAIRIAVILFPLSKNFRIRNAFNSTLIQVIGNIMLPLRFGDGARAYYLSKTEKIGMSSALSALMLDRISDFLIFFTMMALTAILHPFPPSISKMGLVAALIFAGVTTSVFLLAGIGSRIGGNSAGKIRVRIAHEFQNFMTGLSVMRSTGLLFPIFLSSALSWVLRGAMVWVMFKAFRLDLPLMATPITLILLNFGIAIVSTPANLGGFELAAVGALRLFGVEIEVGLSYAVALHAIEVVPMVGFGVIFLWFEGLKTSEVLKPVDNMPNTKTTPDPEP